MLYPVTFKKYGIGVKFVHGDDPADFEAAIDKNTKAIYVESIGNPKYNVAPIPELAKVGLAREVPFFATNVVDTLDCTPTWHSPDC